MVELDKNSMLYWFEKVRKLPVPKPKTAILKLDEQLVDEIFECYYSDRRSAELEVKIEEVYRLLRRCVIAVGGFPAFLRSDQTSGKNFVVSGEPLYLLKNEGDFEKIWALIVECHEPMNILMFAPPKPKALVVREWLKIERWTGKITKYNTIEVRVFAEKGEIKKIYPYFHWSGLKRHLAYLGASEESLYEDYVGNYLVAIKRGLRDIIRYAKTISSIFDEEWSIDFALANGKWFFIDMALAETSWRPSEEDETDRLLEEHWRC